MIKRLIFRITLTAVLAAGAQGQTLDEYQVKAAFLYNFAKFVEWPAQTFQSTSQPIAICVLGQNPFGGSLEETVRGKSVEGRALVVREVSDVRKPCNCQILFISNSERPRWRGIFSDLGSTATLTVGETDGFAAEGGMVNFKLDGGKLRFQINADAADRARLRISSKLLNLAQIVRK
jgi:hypothetical protein